jgi:CNT family concentrative nucleoside transporter
MVIFISALSSVLFHYRILQGVIAFFSLVFRRFFGMSGPEALAGAGNIFLGMAETPTLIAPYLSKLSRSQLFYVMVAGMATVSGSLLVVYAHFLAVHFGGGSEGFVAASAQLLAASVISAPAALVMARILVPDSGEGEDLSFSFLRAPVPSSGFFDALCQGAITGLRLTAYIVAILISVLAMIHLVDALLIRLHEGWSLQAFFSFFLSPLARVMGVAASDADKAGALLGIKVVANEFLAYLQMQSVSFSSHKSALILSWALCGFANFGSIAIMIGSLLGLCPERRSEITSLAFKAMFAGFLATCLTGVLVGILN